MKRVSDLDGAELSLWVARAIGYATDAFLWTEPSGRQVVMLRATDKAPFMPHEEWKDAGPLLSRYGMALAPLEHTGQPGPYQAQGWGPYACQKGHTDLVALCRCIVERTYGPEVPA